MEQIAKKQRKMAVNEKLCRELRIFHLRKFCKMNRILSGIRQVHLLMMLFRRYKQIVHGVWHFYTERMR
ncbi:hypothetical protein TH59_15155 [Pantoea ananatis]|nr:hypothetical protein [Pantoea ananatis]